MFRRKTAKGLAALLALALLCLCACGEQGSIRLLEPTPEPTAPLPTLEPLPERPEDPYVRVYCDGLLIDRGIYRDETVYLDPALLCSELGLPLENTADQERFCIQINDLTVTGEAGTGYFHAGDRYLYAPNGWLTVEDRAYLPADALGRLFGVDIVCAADPLRAEFSTRNAMLMDGNDQSYRRDYTDQEFFWLVHLIAAEAGNQPLAGQIGVGNVILNRVKSESFPDTLREVIFQSDGQAEFSPVDSGVIHMVVDELSLIAAYLVLEGYNTVGDSLFFVNPNIGNSSWVTANRTFVVRIGDHDFYA